VKFHGVPHLPAAFIPPDEIARLQALHELDMAGCANDPELQKLVTLTAQVLDVPICGVSMVERDHVWFAARFGIDVDNWSRANGLCSHVVAGKRTILAHDMRLDERFADNELVVRRIPALRFYAGVPLVFGDGHVVGTLCLMDHRPRHDFDEHKVERLLQLADLVRERLQTCKDAAQMRNGHALFSSGPVAAIVWNDHVQPQPVYLSDNLSDIIGKRLSESLQAGTPFLDLVHPQDQEAVRASLSSHRLGRLPHLEISYRLSPSSRGTRWVHQVHKADYDDQGRLLRIRSYLFDLTRQKQLESSIEATKERLYLALESARIGTWDLNEQTQVRVLNTRAAAMLGYRDDETEHSNGIWTDMIHPHDRVGLEQAVSAYVQHQSDVIAAQYRIRHKKGHYIWVQSFGRAVEYDERGRAKRLVGTLIDITEVKRQEALRNHQRQLLDLLNQAQTSFLLNRNVEDACQSLFEPLLRISDSAFGFIGIVQHHPDGQPYLSVPTLSAPHWMDGLLNDGVGPDGALQRRIDRLDNLFGHVITSNQVVLTNRPNEHPANRGTAGSAPRLANFLGLPIRFDHQVLGMIGLGNRAEGFDEPLVELLQPLLVTLGTLFHARDQEVARASAERELLRLATRDALTGLANRRAFFDVAESVLVQTRRYGMPMTVALLDLDHFKHINDTYGHAAGDQVLNAFAEILRASLRDTDTPARVGGEEFAILLPSTPMGEAMVALERIRDTLDHTPLQVGTHTIYVTVSIGAVQWTLAHPDVDAMLAQADTALYSAKRQGRNRIELYHPELVAVDQSHSPAPQAANDAA